MSEKKYLVKTRAVSAAQYAYDTTEFMGMRSACNAFFNERIGSYKNQQMYVEYNGRIVAIECHNALLWLDRVPPPQYFHGPPAPRSELKEQKQLLLPYHAGCGMRIPESVMGS